MLWKAIAKLVRALRHSVETDSNSSEPEKRKDGLSERGDQNFKRMNNKSVVLKKKGNLIRIIKGDRKGVAKGTRRGVQAGKG